MTSNGLTSFKAVCYCLWPPAGSQKLMAKQRRGAANRSPRTVKSKGKPAGRPASRTRRPKAASTAAVANAVVQPGPRPAPEAPKPVPKRPAYYEAIAAYETGVRALQRHDFTGAAEHFRTVLQRHPDERELVERATLYLRVCERETENRAGPRTPGERIYAATVALNSGNPEAALTHLRQALADDPENDHANYIMAVALSDRGQMDDALTHLRRAITLNPENRSLAIQDPDLSVLRETAAGRELLDAHDPLRRPSRSRR